MRERSIGHAVVATGFPFRRKERHLATLPAMAAALERFEDLRAPGAACLDLAWTACGVFDGFFELSLAPWDLAAGALLVQEAGGIVTDRRAERTSWPATSWPVPKPCTASFSRWPARYVERAAPRLAVAR